MQTTNPDYKKKIELQNFRNNKFQENLCKENKFQRYNRCYTMQEIRENGVQLIRPKEKLQSNTQNTKIILSEYIL